MARIKKAPERPTAAELSAAWARSLVALTHRPRAEVVNQVYRRKAAA
jgi:hypothetical protein